jgi:hypothetical protein
MVTLFLAGISAGISPRPLARTSWRTPVLFLALLIPVVAAQVAAAEDQPGPAATLSVDLYSGAVAPATPQDKAFWLWIEKLQNGEEPGAGWFPKVIHIEHGLSDKDFDIAGEGDADGQKIVVQGHVSRQADGKCRIAFSQLGPWRAGHSAGTDLTLEQAERRVLRLPISHKVIIRRTWKPL